MFFQLYIRSEILLNDAREDWIENTFKSLYDTLLQVGWLIIILQYFDRIDRTAPSLTDWMVGLPATLFKSWEDLYLEELGVVSPNVLPVKTIKQANDKLFVLALLDMVQERLQDWEEICL